MNISVRRFGVLGAIPVAATALFFLAPTASAANTCSSTDGASACYRTGTHVLSICDTAPDGNSPYAWWNPGSSHAQANRNEFRGGNGKCGDYPVTGSGGKLSFQACNDVNNWPDNCGDWNTVQY